MKVGIAIPCHVNDQRYLRNCLRAIGELNPSPYCYYVSMNKGEESMRMIRSDMFDRLFSCCDVVLNCDVDFLLYPHILKYVSEDLVTSFAQRERNSSDFIQSFVRIFWSCGWSGCYTIPRDEWFYKVRNHFDGTDTSIKNAVSKYKFVRRPCYTAIRPRNTFSLRRSVIRRLRGRTRSRTK